MKNLKNIIEGLKINSKTKIRNDYEDYGKGEMDNLSIDDSLCKLFNINLSDNKLTDVIVEIYDMMKKYKIPINDKFYHIEDKNVQPGGKLIIHIRKSNLEDEKRLIINKDVQIGIYKTPEYFIVAFIGYNKNNKLINDYYLHII